MPKYRLDIAYEGTHFFGWQIQPHDISIQGTIEKALTTLLRAKTRLIGSARTDAGVHALGQVAHFVSDALLNTVKILYSLNALLPPSIRILRMQEVSEEFHAQYSATKKEYHYHVWLDPISDPFLYPYRYHVHTPLSLPLLREAATLFVGTHDFASFANVGSHVKTTTRTLYRLDIVEERGGIRFECEGNGFLYKMVRNIVGTLLEFGAQKRDLKELVPLFERRKRAAGGMAAPPHALFLIRVEYPSCEQKRDDEKKDGLFL